MGASLNPQHLASYVQQLARDLEMEAAPLKETQESYSFSFGEETSLTLHALPQGYFFTGVVGPPPPKEQEDFFSLLMNANLFGIGTGENFLGLSDDGLNVVLTHFSPSALNYGQFKEKVEEFVNYLELWQKKTKDAKNLENK